MQIYHSYMYTFVYCNIKLFVKCESRSLSNFETNLETMINDDKRISCEYNMSCPLRNFSSALHFDSMKEKKKIQLPRKVSLWNCFQLSDKVERACQKIEKRIHKWSGERKGKERKGKERKGKERKSREKTKWGWLCCTGEKAEFNLLLARRPWPGFNRCTS